MPGAVANAAPTGTLPSLPIYGFSETREYLVPENRYAGGESERAVLAAPSRRAWKIRWRLTPTQLTTLKTFYESHGITVPFNFTPLNDTPTVAAKFHSGWTETTAWANRTEVNLDLIQVS